MFTTIGILQRLYQRDAQGAEDSSHLDVSMLACQWACLENAFARYLNTGVVPSPIGSRHPSAVVWELQLFQIFQHRQLPKHIVPY